MRVKVRGKNELGQHPAPQKAAAPVQNMPRRSVLFTTLLASCSSTSPALAQDEQDRQPLPPAETPSELLAFSEQIHKLEVRASFLHLAALSHRDCVVPMHRSKYLHVVL